MKFLLILLFVVQTLAIVSKKGIYARNSTCPTTPTNLVLTNQTTLPDPFTFLSGSPVTTLSDWKCRQDEISSLMQTYELGTKPPKPSIVTAAFTEVSASTYSLTIGCTEGTKTVSFSVTITYQSTPGPSPYPAIIAYGGASIPVPATAAIITFNNDIIAAENDQSSRGVGIFYDLYGATASAGATMAWAWGVSRIIDALEMTPAANIDTTKIGVTGCSRDGKGALVAGAFDERIALTIPQESGSGGSACWRLSDAMMTAGQDVQTASEIVRENVWFSPTFTNYSNSVDLLPFDHHLLAALVAPRGLLVIENAAYLWLGPWSCYGCMMSAKTIWTAMGVPDNMGFSEVGNHSHCAFPAVQQPTLLAFIDKFLLGRPANTSNVMDYDFGEPFNATQWANWATPTLM
ncbi:4-O-methyl-glucuronoyl methylesterase [Lachnellula suecica]|uniref:(4-O-methyl)-D-glucuronate--lignin esterase n=1 Tax=Lachnellula suecica TaxID=602035 RepID=A0A8T9CA48_9HELO|nr:4-O-methyl-glucuronoyl methylesterase [Lachnellula suecica]